MHSAAITLLVWAALWDIDLAGTERAKPRATMGALEVQVAQIVPGAPGFKVAEGETTLHLSWLPNPTNTKGYRVYRGRSIAGSTTLVSQVAHPLATVIYTLGDLAIAWGDPICFRLKAYNDDGSSDFSDGVCAVWP